MWHGVGMDVSGVRNTKEEDKVSRFMMGSLIAFARKPVEGLEGLGWSRYGGNATLVALGRNDKPGVVLVDPEEYDSQC